MRAVVLDYQHRTLQARDVPEPARDLKPNEVLFRIHMAGVCGTDRELAQFSFGYPPAGSSFMILGHEATGEVVAAGSSVNHVQAGDTVAPMVRRSCSPACDTCAAGRRDYCRTGRYTERGIFGAHGYFTKFAVDDAADLVVVPQNRTDFGVLIEPLSVVEKAVQRALDVHPWTPRTAVVLGGGTIGILSALVLRERGLNVVVQSIESTDSSRARLISRAGLPYTNRFDGKADIIIEAAGSEAAAMQGLSQLAQMGVLVILGAKQGTVTFPFLQLIVNNQVVLGSVNASPEAARAAVADIERFEPEVLDSLIHRTTFDSYRDSILGTPADRPKIVHMLS
jgi:threonine dehydrogenase-like Zn-dependent dehydrogenase